MNIKIQEKIQLHPSNNARLTSLCGPFDDNIKQLENQLNVIINRNYNIFTVSGQKLPVNIAINSLLELYTDTELITGKINDIDPKQVYLTIKHIQNFPLKIKSSYNMLNNLKFMQIPIKLKHKTIKPRTLNQVQYITNIFNHDITFGIGPSGTGKTYLAIAAAIDLIERKKNQHIVLCRPAIEAGEKLGFLPGDFNQKIDPYIRPLYDALYDLLGYEQMESIMQKHIIEIIPLAYMRGRTLNDSVIILDEAQNTTIAQMKMFLTRIGFNSIAIITGDVTQIDLPSHQQSGLADAIKILSAIKTISFNYFNKNDSVRHKIVTQIINAYEQRI